MSLKHRRQHRSDAKAGSDAAPFVHASGHTDLADILGDHTLHDDAVPLTPKGYRARTMAKPEPRRR
jgi:hypothetical protein